MQKVSYIFIFPFSGFQLRFYHTYLLYQCRIFKLNNNLVMHRIFNTKKISEQVKITKLYHRGADAFKTL